MKKADQAEKKGDRVLANQRRNQAWRQFRNAVDSAKEISGRPESRWARNAKMYLDRWLELSEEVFGERIPVRKDISTYTSEGWRLFRDGKYLECIESFQKAVEVGDPAIYGKTLIPESLYQMGLAYYKLSSPGHTQRKYNYYYESALCFTRILREYPQADFAADAGYYGMQLFGALFNQTRKRVDVGQLPELGDRYVKYDGQRYYRALQEFSEQFPQDPRAEDTIFQSAEVARTLEQYGDASKIYASIKQDHPRYYEAKYRAGLCLYLQALKMFGEQEEPELSRIGQLLDQAASRYQDFIAWYDENKDWLGEEQLQAVNRWIVETKISFGKLLVHKVWGAARDGQKGARRALEVLADIEDEHLKGSGRGELRAEFLPQAFFVTIQAYRRLDQLQEAEEFVDQLVERFGEDELSARAARFLGYAYLQRRQDLDEQGAGEAEIRMAARSAGKYLRKALELQPDQSLEFYNSTAAQLFEMEEYGEAVRILESGLERFPIEEGEAPSRAQLAALGGIKDAYREQEQWAMVQQTVERLLDIEERLNERREAEGKQELKNVTYRRDYALALEEQKKWEEAHKYWREAKSLAENMEGKEGRRLKFNATLHLARCYAQMGGADNVKHGYKVIAWYLLSNSDWLRSEEWAAQVEELFANHFPDKFSDLGQFLIQLVEADLDLVRQRTSRRAILDIKDRLTQEHQNRIDQLIQKAEVGLGTGE
jgi:tetratricopeptide (TPR) repeat protein